MAKLSSGAIEALEKGHILLLDADGSQRIIERAVASHPGHRRVQMGGLLGQEADIRPRVRGSLDEPARTFIAVPAGESGGDSPNLAAARAGIATTAPRIVIFAEPQ